MGKLLEGLVTALSLVLAASILQTWDPRHARPDLRLLVMEPSPLPASALARLAAAGWGLCHVHMLDFLKNGTGICRWQFS